MLNKITIVSPVFPYRGGIANFTELLYENLKEKVNVRIINFTRQYPSFLFPGKTQFDTETVKNIESERLLDSINPISWLNTAKTIVKQSSDVLIFAYWHPFFAPAYGKIAKYVRKKTNMKIVALCHNVLPHETNFYDIPLTRFFFNNVDSAITLSEKVLPDLDKIKKGIERKALFHPVYNNFGEPINKSEAREKLNINSDENLILYFGFIRKYKGVDILLRAAAILRKKLNFKLIIAGEFYDDKNKYIKIIDDLRLHDFILLHDKYIPQDKVKIYFSAADVIVLPYRSATQSGIAQMANNFHKPVIGTNVGGLQEIIKNDVNGYLVDAEDPLLLAEAIEKFFNEKNEEKFVSNIKINAENFSWENFVNEFIEFLSK